MTQSLDDIMSDRVNPALDALPEITDADRAANPIGTAKLERERDTQGRFAPKTEAEPQEGEEPAVTEGEQPPANPDQRRDGGMVPRQAMLAERRKFQDLEASIPGRIQEEVQKALRGVQMPPVQPQSAQPENQQRPEWYADPDAALDYRLTPVQQELRTMRIENSHFRAQTQFGEQVVEEALQAAAQFAATDPTFEKNAKSLLETHPHAIGEIVRWHKAQQTQQKLQQFGGDPEAYIKAEVERRMAELQGEADERPQQQPAAQPPARLPSSFAAQRSGGPRGGQGYGGPRPLSELMPRG